MMNDQKLVYSEVKQANTDYVISWVGRDFKTRRPDRGLDRTGNGPTKSNYNN